MPKFRVFVDRYYIAVRFYDIEAKDAVTAEKLAIKAADTLVPDARAEATDNHWHIDREEGVSGPGSGAIEIEEIGKSSTGINPTKEVFKDARGTVYAFSGADALDAAKK